MTGRSWPCWTAPWPSGTCNAATILATSPTCSSQRWLDRSSHLAARFALGLATGQEWSHFYYLNGGSEIARVEVPD